jgi:hypothetical protein
MFDPVSLVTGAALVGVGWAAGRRRKRATSGETVVARCGCGHDIAMHDPQSQQCHAEIKRRVYGMTHWARCGCRRYTGPQPITDFFAPPLLTPPDAP